MLIPSPRSYLTLLWRLPMVIGLVLWFIGGPTETLTLDSNKVVLDDGLAYRTAIDPPSHFPFIIKSDSVRDGNTSLLTLSQGGRPLGPAHSSHEEIRKKGGGLFSHWETSLYFSTQDNQPLDVSSLEVKLTYEIPGWLKGIFLLCVALEFLVWLYSSKLSSKYIDLAFNITFLILGFYVSYLITILFIDAFFYASINSDAGYFLSVAERMREGSIPYRDFSIAYTPLGLIFLAIFRSLFSGWASPFELYLSGILFIEVATGIAAFVVSSFFVTSKPLRFLIATMTILGCHIFEGDYIALEPFAVLFAVASLGFLFREDRTGFFIAGAFGALAFFSKQYGIAALIPLTGAVVFSGAPWRHKILSVGFIASGALSVLILFLSILRFCYGVPFEAVLNQFWTRGYIAGVADLSGYKHYLLNVSPFLLMIPILFFMPSARRQFIFHALLLGFFSMSLPLLIRPFLHYYILLIPFAFLLGAFVINILLKSERHWIRISAIVPLLGFFPMIQLGQASMTPEANFSIRQNQYLQAAVANSVWPQRSEVVVLAGPWITYQANFSSPRSVRPEYAFLTLRTAEQLDDVFTHNDKILIDTKSQNYFLALKSTIEGRYGNFVEYLKKKGFCLTSCQDAYEFWAKTCGN